jgi:hypothetical protein
MPTPVRSPSQPAPELDELRMEVADMRRANDWRRGPDAREERAHRQARPAPQLRLKPNRRTCARRRLTLAGGVIVLGVAVALLARSTGPRSFALPSRAALAGLGTRGRIVAIADSQVGYATEPSGSYCDKYSAAWGAGNAGCPAGERSEKWCADFAAWVWRHAGVRFTYGFGPGDINAGAISFYRWAVATGRWHPAVAGFRPALGDVAVYGISFGSEPSAAHVAIVTSDPRGQAGPDVINGDGDRTGFSVVETARDELAADTGDAGGDDLAGYASPF